MDIVSTAVIKNRLREINSIRYRDIMLDEGNLLIIYDITLCDSKFISEFIISPILNKSKTITNTNMLSREIITAVSAGLIESDDKAVDHIMSGDAVLIFDFLGKAVYCPALGYPKRALEAPPTETVIKGPREGFNEILQDNISAIKRRIKDPSLKLENMTVGNKSKTQVVLAYIEGNTPTEIVDYVRNKIDEVTSDYVFYSNAIEEKLRAHITSFETVGFTEKPDSVASKLGEGRVAVFVDGSPFVITMPFFFIENFHVTDDYTWNRYIAALGIVLRWSSFLGSVLLPGIYVALFTYHFNLIPFLFVFHMAASRAGVPFPLIVEVLLMLIFFQILREGGIRLPQPIAPTLSIVGALILGDAAVNSGLTSHITVLIVALTSIASFLVPRIAVCIFYWSVILIIFSGLLGLPGFYIGFVLFCSHLAGLTSCGYPYLYPLGTLETFKYKDIIFRGDINDISEYIFVKDDEK